jgi:pimeloyl-ACP methyl ester carboxylesterase
VQKEYLDVLVALANPDINIDKIKTKVFFTHIQTLMIHGKEDIVVRVETVLETGKILGKSLEIWENHGHMIPIEDTKRYVQRITKFIDEQ